MTPVPSPGRSPSARPPFARSLSERLRDEIAAAILAGRHPEGTLLPSVRAMAAREGANPLTVAKAYHYFQEEGLVAVRRGIGLEVLPGAVSRLRERERRRFLSEEWPGLAKRLALLDLRLEDLVGAEFARLDQSP